MGLTSSIIQKPTDNTLEITLIGTGGGYGESVLIHIGNQKWVIVDSCINPDSDIPLPLQYLLELGVNVKSDVKLIICTHWHNDHILGLSKILEHCDAALLSFARANDMKKFLNFVSLDYQKLEKEKRNSSTDEFNKCLDILIKRGANPIWAGKDRLLLNSELNDSTSSQIYSLSPSDYTMAQFDLEISTLITEYGKPNKKVTIKDPNAKSVALLIKAGTHRAILGADLEVSNNKEEGWLNIIESSQSIDKRKATLFKIPHHGSSNGFHERIWIELLEPNSVATITPWKRNNWLPEAEMLLKYCNYSESVFITSPIVSATKKGEIKEKAKPRDREIERIIDKFKYKLSEVKFKRGIIRSRIDILDNTSKWDVQLFENAQHVNKLTK